MRTLIALYTLAALVPAVHAQPWAKEKLEKSPRHQEWVEGEARRPHG